MEQKAEIGFLAPEPSLSINKVSPKGWKVGGWVDPMINFSIFLRMVLSLTDTHVHGIPGIKPLGGADLSQKY